MHDGKTNGQQREQSDMMWMNLRYIVHAISSSLFISSWNISYRSAFLAKPQGQQAIDSFHILLFITSNQSGITGGTGSSCSLGLWILDAQMLLARKNLSTLSISCQWNRTDWNINACCLLVTGCCTVTNRKKTSSRKGPHCTYTPTQLYTLNLWEMAGASLFSLLKVTVSILFE